MECELKPNPKSTFLKWYFGGLVFVVLYASVQYGSSQ